MSERDDLTEQAFRTPGFSPGPSCCIGQCCGLGSYCCGHPDNVHTHTKQEEWEVDNAIAIKAGAGPLEPLYPMKLDLENGKYTLVLSESGSVTALRCGEPWQEFVGDKFMVAVARHIFELGENE